LFTATRPPKRLDTFLTSSNAITAFSPLAAGQLP
jgi:hypothetical protein